MDETPYLGRFVRTYSRKDGSDHVVMEVPTRLRPPGWPKTIKLPQIGRRHGSLRDPSFLGRVRKDADRLNRRIDDLRAEAVCEPQQGRRTVAEAGELLFKTLKFRRVSTRQQNRMRRAVKKFTAWSIERGSPLFADLTKGDIEDFLYIYDGKPAAQTEFLFMWKRLVREAIGSKWRTDDPCADIPWPDRDPKQVHIWTADDVEAYAEAADGIGQHGLSALIRFNFLAGQRLGDVRTARFDRNFNGERFTIKQSKTGKAVTFVVPRQITALIESARYPDSPYMFVDFETGKPFTDNSIGLKFEELREHVAVEGGKKLYLKALRHSAVCRMVAANVPLLKITSVTGHAPENAEKIITRYALDIQRFADSAIMQTHRAEGGSDEDFSDTLPITNQDWLARVEKSDRHVSYYSRALRRHAGTMSSSATTDVLAA